MIGYFLPQSAMLQTSMADELPKQVYPADLNDDTPALEGEYKTIDFPSPFSLVCYFDSGIQNGTVTLHPWQRQVHVDLIECKGTMHHPCKYCLVAANGSGKDKYIIAPFVVWFALTKIRSRTIITTSSGTQLTSQTEPYVVDLCRAINLHYKKEVFRIRQRYIKCLLSGSEIRLFATDEKGKAEGYHPIEPNAEMAIVVNEGKSVSDDIHSALRRCTGYNYWLEVSSAGEPKGFFYRAATHWSNVKYVTSYDCDHSSQEDIESDKIEFGETSAFFRSKHLSRFTSIGGDVVIPEDLIDRLVSSPPTFTFNSWPIRVGIDLAAGGDEDVVMATKGTQCVAEEYFREKDTTKAADKIEGILLHKIGITKSHKHIYADDGGIGRAIIDMLVRRGWTINRIMNQWAAIGNRKQYGNRGAENWYRVRRIIEERYFNVKSLSEKCRQQLTSRHYKQSLTGGRIFLMDKKEERAEGHASPDRADAFILSLTGLSVEDFIAESKLSQSPLPRAVGVTSLEASSLSPSDNRTRQILSTPDEVLQHYEDSITFADYKETLDSTNNKKTNSRVKSLREIMGVNNKHTSNYL